MKNLSLKDKGRVLFWLGIVLLTIRLYMAFYLRDFTLKESSLAAACLRTGVLLTVLGLAWEQIIKIPVWILVALPIACALVIFWPRQALFLVPLLFAVITVKRWFDKWKK